MLLKCRNDRAVSSAGIFLKIPAFIFVLLLFSFTAKSSDLYWIGGSGSWSDINHWSLSSGNSGGMLSPSIPQAGDNVIFDHNSGFTRGSKTVAVNQESSCLNMTVKESQEAPVFEGNILNIYGSADFQTGTVLDNIIYFRSRGTGTISFNSEITGSAAIYFLGSGSYLISGTLNNTGKIYFLKGSLDFGSSVITTEFFDEAGCCGTIPSAASAQRSLNLGSSVITLTGRNSQLSGSPSWNYTGTSLNAGTSQINISKGADDGYGVSFIGKNGHIYNNVSFTSTADPSNSSPYGWYQIADGNCTFNTLRFASSGFIASSCTIDTLNTAKSKTYYLFGSQKIETIQNQTQACEPLWTLSGYGGQQSDIKNTSGLHLQNVRLNYLKASRTASFSVNNGIDGGQNSGWVFTNTPKDFYWIGGGGNWNDPAHWTVNADGTPSGGCLPARSDNVFFNAFSGIISSQAPVIVNSADAECRDISWNGVEGRPVFKTASAGDMLSIFGSSTWQRGMLYQIAAANYMSSAAGNTLTSNGVNIEGDTYFLTEGGWILNDAFSSPQNDIVFRNGRLNTNNQPVAVRDFGSAASGLGIRTLTLGNSKITVNGSWGYVNYGGSPIYLNAGTSRINLTADGAYFYYNSGLTYYNIIFTNKNGSAAAVLYAGLYSTAAPCTFNSLSFAGSAFINTGGSAVPLAVDTLHLSSSKNYVLGTDMELQVTNLSVDGSACNGVLEISSYSQLTKARLNLLHPVQITNAKVTGIHAAGAVLTVKGGIDGGNNQNVVISPVTSRNFYWIGNSGNWSDPKHWTTHADGTPDTMNSCLPGLIDNVFFNRFSGADYTVTLDVPALCNNMTWEEVTGSGPVLKGLTAGPLTINGSLVLQTGMDYDVERTNFAGITSGNTITTHGVVMDYTSENTSDKGVFFNNPAGTWLLSDTFNVKNFGVVNGAFTTNNQTVYADNYYSVAGGSASVLNLGSSVINIAGYWEGAGISKLNAGTSTINMQGTAPRSNSSGGGISNNEFRSKPGLVYNDLNFLNEALPGKIIGYDAGTGNIFNNVVFAGESSINGSSRFNILTLGAGKNCRLSSGTVQSVNQLASGASCRFWNLDNGSTALKAVIKSISDISLNNVRMTGIAVMGGGVYKAAGIDEGNNSGWSFTAPAGKNLYWTGGSGNWNDAAFWTENADGTSSGNSCLPTRFDNVFFNGYSGESPVISITGTAEFHDMMWNAVHGTPSISGTLDCYGSMTLQSSLSHSGGINFLSSETGSTITTRGALAASNFNVNFSGNGSYTLLDDFTADTRINFTSGTLNTNGKTIKALSFTGTESGPVKGVALSLILGASQIYLTYGGEGWSYTGTHLDAGTSRIYLTQSANYFKGRDGAVYHAVSFGAGDNSNNLLYGGITVDSLTFSARNSICRLEAGKTVTVSKQLQMSGTNCSTLQLQSTAAGVQASLCVKGGSTTYNFISIKDINASCLPFTVLPQSTNSGNTANIAFQPDPGTGIGALGPDIRICGAGLPIILDAGPFMPNKNTSIQWSSLTTGGILGTGIKQAVSTAGTYRIKVVYGTGCEVLDDIKVIIDSVINIAADIKITQPGCSAAAGSITMNSPEGITYSVDGGAFSIVTHYELLSGRHTVTAKNERGCLSDTVFITINPQPLMPAADISYGSGEFHAAGKAEVMQTGQGGGTYTVFPSGLVIDKMTGTIDLAASTPDQSYVVTYTFGNGTCTASCTTIVKINSSPVAIAFPLMDYCAAGSVKVLRTGPSGGSYTASPSGLKMHESSGTVDLSGSSAGTYLVTYTCMDGTLKSAAVTLLTVNALPAAKITSDLGTEISKVQTVTLTASGGSSYAWTGAGIQSGQNTSAVRVLPKETTTYSVIAVNKQGCSDVSEITITVKHDNLLIPNNVITPNGDGKNDTWIIKNIDQYPHNSVRIFDRAGRQIYTKKGYANDWDGTASGKILNEDIYIYVIEPGNGTGLIKGTISIIRDQQ